MKNSFKKSLLFMMLLLALTFSAVGTTPALADDGVTPPADAPVVVEEPVAEEPVVVEQPVADAPVLDAPVVEEEPVVDAPVAAEEPAAASEETATVAEVLEQLPEGTDLVVVDSSGEALPLASQEAADTLDSPSADPFFWDGTKYVGYSATGVCPAQVTVCNTSATPLQAAITAFGATPTATGSIYVAAGTYTANVSINGNVGNLKNLNGLIGVDSATTILNGDVTLYNMNIGTNTFTFQGFTLNGALSVQDSTNTLNITDVVQVGSGANRPGIWISHQIGNVTLTDVDAGGNIGYGTQFDIVNGNVTVTTSGGTSAFDNNDIGLMGYSVAGSITINDVALTNNATLGFFSVANSSTPILNCVTFTGNGANVSGTVNQTSVDCTGGGTGGGSTYVNFPAAPVVPPVMPPVVSTVTPQVVTLPVVEDEKGRTTVQYTSLYTILEQNQEQLPAELEAGTFGSALKVALTDQGANVTDLVIKLSFPIPASMKDANLAVMFWNGSAWVEVSGGSVVDGSFVITVSQPGTYVLISK